MFLKNGIRNQVYQNFLEETLELVQQIQDELIELPYSYTAPKIRDLVRAIHTIQSGAVQINFAGIETLVKQLEKTFDFLEQKNIETDMLLQAYGSLRLFLLDRSNNEEYDTSSALTTTETVFANLETRSNHHIEAVSDISTITQEDVDTSRLILTTEISQELEHLEMILAHTHERELAQELASQAEVFLGLGELLELSGFVAIARTTLATLETTPQAAYNIGQLALAGLRSTYEAILKADFSIDTVKEFPKTKLLGTKDKELLSIAPAQKISQQVYLWSADASTNTQRSTSQIRLKTSKLFVWVAGHTIFTLKTESVEDILIPQDGEIISSRAQKFLHWREQMLPVYQVSQLLTYITPRQEANSKDAFPEGFSVDNPSEPLFIISQEQLTLALKPDIEFLITQPELVIQPFSDENRLPSYVHGYTIWKDNPLQVIDIVGLLAYFNQTVDRKQLAQMPSVDILGASNKTILTATIKKPTVLVVDDSKTVRQIISLALQEAGYQVLQAQDGQEAIAQLQQNPRIQLVICDIEMPNLNGFEFLSYRLKDPMLTKIPVVVLSTCNSSKHRQLAMQLGAVQYFTKPYVKQEFLAALKGIIQKNG
ncbi:response regulator [Aetokthonos hydrillicola Thurmond2011]|jgi:CheY-like chemotaxis protein/chemotaxis protein histidine kinase CheA|uniref:Response regulator n=1 Tax=Aetokthonos hydrillicola Thurmond2011 TaxID=2712845 RepID=A0AAP5I9T5_9CYAN|nr:response regulator [Aetokthonos hydrillicola]MBO3462346.1 response regulator [Aetokthonos hydrillicola CCALA 1050]MBW4588837.1 response regulator [Aetokthonos hydrillicola CCALA 1050]MDR9897299.1 response regulator [Aetokthonos hydrillicola Thurmond2011]